MKKTYHLLSCSVCTQELKDSVQFLCRHQLCKQCLSLEHSDSPGESHCPECAEKLLKATEESAEKCTHRPLY
uniref:RING-type domain-containing protein n=1 Tax=Oryzias latipes TaxID=8090 RepID=A0A3P9JKW0_ORYLA